MFRQRTSNGTLETLAWSAFFIWWGIIELVPSLPRGIGALGLGVILLGRSFLRTSSTATGG
jgi:hypothetical protein